MSGRIVEADEVRAQASHWLRGLVTAGVPASVIGTGALVALIEVMLVNGGVGQTAVWLHNMARQVDDCGEEWLASLTLDSR